MTNDKQEAIKNLIVESFKKITNEDIVLLSWSVNQECDENNISIPYFLVAGVLSSERIQEFSFQAKIASEIDLNFHISDK